MEVSWSADCLVALEAELQVEGRPTINHFEEQLRHAIELEFATYWVDEAKVGTDPATGLLYVRTDLVPPHMFPPGVHFARMLTDNHIEIVAVDFHWDYWDLIADDPD